MKSSHLISSFFTSIWAIEPNKAFGYFPIVNQIISGKRNIDVAGELPELESASYSRKSGGSSTDNEKTVLVLSYKDVVLKYDQYCGPSGTETLAKQIKQAANDPSIAAIVLDWDTPGGDGGACQLPSQAILDAREKKPVLSYVGNGMCASAGYYMASNSTEIYATFETDEIGSIGTYVTVADWLAYYEKEGLKVMQIYASKSTNKNGPIRDLFAAKTDEEKQAAILRLQTEYLDPFNQQFLNTVMEQRGISEDSEVLTGKLYYAKDAEKMGLIDGLKTFDEVIDRAFELSENYQGNNSQINNSNNMFGKFKALNTLAKTSAEERTPEQLDAVNQELQAIGINGFLMEATEGRSSSAEVNTAITDAEATINTANDERNSAQAERDTAQDEATRLQGELDTATARITELEGESSGVSTSGATKNDDLGGGNSAEKIMDEMEHNKSADAYGF